MNNVAIQHIRMKDEYFHEKKWSKMVMLRSENRWFVRSNSDCKLYMVRKRQEMIKKCDCEK